MATVQQQSGSKAEDSFVADRAMFWERFTGFVKYGTMALAVLLIAMWLFLV